MVRTHRGFGFLVGSAFAALLYVGCTSYQTPEQPHVETSGHSAPAKVGEAKPKPVDEAEHAHKPGSHGGIIVELGRDSYHVEAVFEKGGILRLYTLGRDEAKVQEVDAQTPTAYVKLDGDAESTSVQFKPVPQPGDAEGKTSQFLVQLPKELIGKRIDVTIPSIRVANERFRLGFASAEESHASEPMPAKVADDEEKALYLTPGGKYTEADIAANGNVTAAQKFKGLMASHDMKPKPGDKICPVTMTKANPKFSWVIGGKSYEFCCPPCVDEFVKTAKEKPADVKEPQEYVKN